MKHGLLVIALLFLDTCIFSQGKMIMTVKDQKCDILGYRMDPDASGDKKTISFFGPMQNTDVIFQYAYESGTPLTTILVLITDPSAQNTTITLTNATVYGFKKYLSAYSNGIFNVSFSGNPNTELKCRFEKIEIQQGGGTPDEKDINAKNIKTALQQPWDIKMDSAAKGIGGAIIMQLPKEAGFHTHMEFYNKDDNKKVVASWFGNNKANLMPGFYDIVVDKKYTIKNVPVEKNKQTRLKMGVFKVSNYGSMEIENSDHQKFSYAPPFSILLPEGTYFLNGKKKLSFEIKDGQLTEL